jgi:hypothetical protein
MEHRWQYEARDSGESRGEFEGLIDEEEEEEEEEEWEIARHYHIQVLIEGADVLPITVPIQTIDRPRERVEEVGLQTAEAKSILRKLQQIVVQDRSPTTWFLWHGNVWRADDTLSSLIDEVDGVREEDCCRPQKYVPKSFSEWTTCAIARKRLYAPDSHRAANCALNMSAINVQKHPLSAIDVQILAHYL